MCVCVRESSLLIQNLPNMLILDLILIINHIAINTLTETNEPHLRFFFVIVGVVAVNVDGYI